MPVPDNGTPKTEPSVVAVSPLRNGSVDRLVKWLPVFLMLAGMAGAWTLIQHQVEENAMDIERLVMKQETHGELLAHPVTAARLVTFEKQEEATGELIKTVLVEIREMRSKVDRLCAVSRGCR